MFIVANDAFEFDWPDPELAAQTWEWDGMHCPGPLPPLAAEASAAWSARVFDAQVLHVNGYAYGPRGGVGDPPMSGDPLSMPEAIQRWERERLPAAREIARELRDPAWRERSLDDLAAALPRAMQRSAEGFNLTMRSAFDVFPGLTPYLEFCASHFGLQQGPTRGMTMLQGHPNATTDSGRALELLAEQAASLPALASALRDGRFEGLRAINGAGEFCDAFDALLEREGWRVPTWFEIHTQTWAEDPALALSMVARYLDPERRPSRATAASALARVEAIALAEADLPDDDARARFRELLAGATGYVQVIEGRALYQQQLAAGLRVPALALGARLVEAGALEAADDVFYLDTTELAALAGAPDASRHDEVTAMRDRLAHWRTLIPPATIGEPSDKPPRPEAILLQGRGVRPSDDARLVNGYGACPGTARGVARVIRDARELHRLQPGDVLVCPFTAPTWTPAFSVASAMVTDAGGVLSHAAIAAREYALPAVVGTRVGTRKIPDGATVTVDGTQGIVRIEH